MAREPDAEDSGSARPEAGRAARGFFPMDRISVLMLLGGVAVLALSYVPVLLDPEATLFGYPWMFAVKPPLGLLLGGSFVVATYWLDSLEAGTDHKKWEREARDG